VGKAMQVLLVIALAAQASPSSAQPTFTLRDALAAALEHVGVAQSVSAAQQSEAVARSSGAGPTLGISGSYADAPQPGAPTQSTFAEQLTLDFGSPAGRSGRVLAARANAAAATAAVAQTRLSLEQSVTETFFDLATDLAQLEASGEAVNLAQRSLDAAIARHRVGLAPLADVLRARSALATLQAEQAAASAALAGDRSSLSEAVGSAIPTSLRLPAPDVIPDEDSVTRAVLVGSPALASASAALRAAKASVLVARGELQPSLSVGAGPGQISQGGVRTAGPSATATLVFPFAGGVEHTDVAAARAQLAAAQSSYDTTRIDIIRSALVLRAQALAAQARLVFLDEAFADANRVAQASLGGYRLGAVSSADLVTAQTQAASTRSALATGRVQAVRAQALLKLQIGDQP